jgi:hypothetical protein
VLSYGASVTDSRSEFGMRITCAPIDSIRTLRIRGMG